MGPYALRLPCELYRSSVPCSYSYVYGVSSDIAGGQSGASLRSVTTEWKTREADSIEVLLPFLYVRFYSRMPEFEPCCHVSDESPSSESRSLSRITGA
ncbi:hypothetical protein B296_00000003 [Ensete ventricosum]|uniref:Uncharacterized protein n=1 Tax=Ensete ventricosum TaxID=4639 RepID=A0A427ASL4_ENSVE|nr:hypothetical protein B296_00000003 [Ensete ventricosum]